jgi:hypothetical protein
LLKNLAKRLRRERCFCRFIKRVEFRPMFWELAAADLGVEEVGAEVGMATAKEIRGAGSIIRVFGGFEVRVRSFSKS